MKKYILMASVAILMFGITAESWAETTCTWEGTKLIIGGSGEFSGCDSVYDDNNNEIDWETQQEKITEIEFGDDVTAIGDYAFENSYNLTKLNTNNIEIIGNGAFAYSGVVDVELPNVRELEDDVFYDAYNLTSVTMPKMEKMGSNVFELTTLKQIEIPDSLVFADYDAFQTSSDVVLIISDEIDMRRWSSDVLSDDGDGTVTFKCKGNQDVCRAKIEEFAARATSISGNNIIFDAGDHRECFRTPSDDENVSYYHTGTECAKLPESGNITCASGYADYNGNCYAQVPFSKKRWTPAEANEWLHDGNDNFVVITFKK